MPGRKVVPDKYRLPLQVAVLALGAATIVVPLLIITFKPAKVAAFLALTFIFHNIITGSMGLPFYRLFPAKQVRRYHVFAGVTGFALGITHMVILLLNTSLGYYSRVWLLGPIALVLLALTIGVALDRKRLPRVWRRIHQVNYAIFVALLVKCLLIGSDLLTKPALRAVLYSYAAIAGLGLIYRLSRYSSERRRARARAAG